uniref:Uncharacterized protein n=1 Tax=Anopheles farauti TaxID=69004 RepID=A0A182QCV9_9DIPT
MSLSIRISRSSCNAPKHSSLRPSSLHDEALCDVDADADDEDDCRPQRAGFSEARNELVLEEAPVKRDRDEPEPDAGVCRPDDDDDDEFAPIVVALLMNSCITEETPEPLLLAVELLPLAPAPADEEPAVPAPPCPTSSEGIGKVMRWLVDMCHRCCSGRLLRMVGLVMRQPMRSMGCLRMMIHRIHRCSCGSGVVNCVQQNVPIAGRGYGGRHDGSARCGLHDRLHGCDTTGATCIQVMVQIAYHRLHMLTSPGGSGRNVSPSDGLDAMALLSKSNVCPELPVGWRVADAGALCVPLVDFGDGAAQIGIVGSVSCLN